MSNKFYIKHKIFDFAGILLCHSYADGLELLPAAAVREADHEMVLAGIHVCRNGNGLLRLERGAPGGNGIVLVQDPRIHRLFHRILPALARFGTVGVMVEVVMDLDIVGTQFLIVLEQVVEEDGAAAGIFLTVERGRGIADGNDFRHGSVCFSAAARTECAQQRNEDILSLHGDVRLLRRHRHRRSRSLRHGFRPWRSVPRCP